MKHLTTFIIISTAFAVSPLAFAQDTEPATEAAEGLDLFGVAELLKAAENLEDFEKRLNAEANEVNNLDLDADDQVDYITVHEEAEGDTHVAILRVPLSENEYQDVASVELEKVSDDQIAVQVVGDEELYGPDYIIEPAETSASLWPAVGTSAERVVTWFRSPGSTRVTVSLSPATALLTGAAVVTVRISAWPLLRVVFGPGYRVWRSPYRWGFFPPWWRPWRPVARSVYRARHARWAHARWHRTAIRHSHRARNIYHTQRRTTHLSRHAPRAAPPKAIAPPKAGPPKTQKPGTPHRRTGPPPKKKPTPRGRGPGPN